MKALLQKDAVWVGALLAAGGIALTAAIGERGGFHAFVLGSWRHEALFHCAWIGGLVLGAVAGCFDELLGTREYLRQRPVSWRQVFAARLAGCGTVLLGWFVVAPVGAWLPFAVFEDGWQFTRWQTLGPLLASMVPAVSACMIGLAAATLPAVWWLRLLAATAWFLAAFGCAWQLSTDSQGYADPATFVAIHLLAAAACLVVAFVAARHSADADRPWTGLLRVVAGGAIAIGVVLIATAVVREVQQVVVRALHRAYPVAVRHGNEIVLAHRDAEHRWQLVTADHVPTGTELPAEGLGMSWSGPDDWPHQYEFDAPRWRDAGSSSFGLGGRIVYLAANGQAWVREGTHAVVVTGKGEQRVAFGARSTMGTIDDTCIVIDADTHDLWRFEEARGWFLPVATPDGDPLQQFDRAWLEAGAGDDLRQRLQVARDQSRGSVDFVRGRRGDYVLREGRLVSVPGLRQHARTGWSRDFAEAAPRDVITYSLDVPGSGAAAPFHHEVTPRTTRERVTAGAAMLWSLMRPPVLQGIAHMRPAVQRPAWWFDALVLGGRRPWLVFAGIAFAALLAWRVARRLRRLRAPSPAVTFWVVTTLLLGPIAAVLSVVFERPRAYADRTLPGPFPAPRIVTHTPIEEPVA